MVTDLPYFFMGEELFIVIIKRKILNAHIILFPFDH